MANLPRHHEMTNLPRHHEMTNLPRHHEMINPPQYDAMKWSTFRSVTSWNDQTSMVWPYEMTNFPGLTPWNGQSSTVWCHEVLPWLLEVNISVNIPQKSIQKNSEFVFSAIAEMYVDCRVCPTQAYFEQATYPGAVYILVDVQFFMFLFALYLAALWPGGGGENNICSVCFPPPPPHCNSRRQAVGMGEAACCIPLLVPEYTDKSIYLSTLYSIQCESKTYFVFWNRFSLLT